MTKDDLTIWDLLPATPRDMKRVEDPRPPPSGSQWAWWTWGPLRVCVSLDDCGADGLWLHTSVSASQGRRLPTWAELARVKDVVHGDRLVVQILPPRAEYVNVAEVLHLWERLDAPTLPSAIARKS